MGALQCIFGLNKIMHLVLAGKNNWFYSYSQSMQYLVVLPWEFDR